MSRLGKLIEFIANGLRARSTREFYDASAGIYEGVCAGQEQWARKLLERAPAAECGLDIACGTGVSTAVLGERCGRVIGLDFSAGMLARARERLTDATYALVQGDFLWLPLADCSVDVACCIGGTRHIPAGLEGRFLEEAHRVLAPGGNLIIPATEPTLGRRAYALAYNGFMRLRGLDERVTFWTPERTERLLRMQGFSPRVEPIGPRAYAAIGTKIFSPT
jgi:ubiquinone/menaquinone biosynthesis C-methylase UbiE